VAKWVSTQLVNEPLSVDYVFEYLAQERMYGADIRTISGLMSGVDKTLNQAAGESRVEMTGDLCFQLMTQAADSAHQREIEMTLEGLLSRETDPKKVVGVLYEATAKGLATGDEKMLNYLLRVFNYDTGILSGDSRLTLNYAANIFSDDDTALRQFMELDAFSELLSPYINPQLAEVKAATNGLAMSKVVAQKEQELGKPLNRNPRTNSLLMFYRRNPGLTRVESDDLARFPNNIVSNSGPVREATNEIYLRMSGSQEQRIIKFPGENANLYVADEDAEVHQEHRDSITRAVEKYRGDERPLDINETRTVLDYLRPELMSVAEIGAVTSLARKKREQIILEPKRSISVNGTEIVVTDDGLRKMGFRSILYENSDNPPEMDVTVRLGRHKFLIPMRLNGDMVLTDTTQKQPLNRGELKADYISAKWMEAVVLSHLAEYTCVEQLTKHNVPKTEEAMPAKREVEEAPEIFEKTFTRRIGHLRLLQPGEHFAADQVTLAQKEQGWDLIKINEEREKKGLRPQTYVRVVDKLPVGAHRPPDRFRAHTAMIDLNKIVVTNQTGI
jgi:hypothetical protein